MVPYKNNNYTISVSVRYARKEHYYLLSEEDVLMNLYSGVLKLKNYLDLDLDVHSSGYTRSTRIIG